MKTIAVYEAKNRLSEILAAVELGEEYTITKRGEPIARLVPPAHDDPGGQDVAALIAKLKALSDAGKPVEFDLREAIEEGRD